MKKLFGTFIGVCSILSIFSFWAPAFAADVQFVTIGTAAPGGTFYVLGVGIADVINKNLKDDNFKATAITTGKVVFGSVSTRTLVGDRAAEPVANNPAFKVSVTTSFSFLPSTAARIFTARMISSGISSVVFI